MINKDLIKAIRTNPVKVYAPVLTAEDVIHLVDEKSYLISVLNENLDGETFDVSVEENHIWLEVL